MRITKDRRTFSLPTSRDREKRKQVPIQHSEQTKSPLQYNNTTQVESLRGLVLVVLEAVDVDDVFVVEMVPKGRITGDSR